MNVDDIIRAQEFRDFYESVIDYCYYIEQDSITSTIDFLHNVRKKLLSLYINALNLPWVDLQSEIEYDNKLDDIEFDNILSYISDKLGDSRFYWQVFDPTNQDDTEPVCGDLLDDLGDIYKDLKFSLVTFNLDKEDCKENALWQFKFDFDKHWYDHCINALSAIHYYLQNE